VASRTAGDDVKAVQVSSGTPRPRGPPEAPHPWHQRHRHGPWPAL